MSYIIRVVKLIRRNQSEYLETLLTASIFVAVEIYLLIVEWYVEFNSRLAKRLCQSEL